MPNKLLFIFLQNLLSICPDFISKAFWSEHFYCSSKAHNPAAYLWPLIRNKFQIHRTVFPLLHLLTLMPFSFKNVICKTGIKQKLIFFRSPRVMPDSKAQINFLTDVKAFRNSKLLFRDFDVFYAGQSVNTVSSCARDWKGGVSRCRRQ